MQARFSFLRVFSAKLKQRRNISRNYMPAHKGRSTSNRLEAWISKSLINVWRRQVSAIKIGQRGRQFRRGALVDFGFAIEDFQTRCWNAHCPNSIRSKRNGPGLMSGS